MSGMNRSLARLLRWLALSALLLAGFFLLPALAYRAGKALIGPSGWQLGLSDYLARIHAGAAAGELLAWWLLLAPLMVAMVWWLVFRLARRRDAE